MDKCREMMHTVDELGDAAIMLQTPDSDERPDVIQLENDIEYVIFRSSEPYCHESCEVCRADLTLTS